MGFALLFCRAFGFSLFLPFGQGISDLFVRIGFSIIIAFALSAAMPEINNFSFALVVFEIIFGILLSLPLVISIDLLSAIPEFFDTARGMNIAQVYDPNFETERSICSTIFRHAVWVFFIWQGLFAILMKILFNSYQIVAPWDSLKIETIGKVLSLILSKFSLHILSTLSAVFILSLPFILLSLFVDVFFGFLAKLLPNIQLQQDSFFVKTILGLLLAVGLIKLDLQNSVLQVLHQYSSLMASYG